MHDILYVNNGERMNKNTKLAHKYNYKILSFKKLPVEARYALIYYMAINGEAWEIADGLEEAWRKGLPSINNGSAKYWNKVDSIAKEAIKTSKVMKFYMDNYGNEKFGFVHIPTHAMKKRFMESEWGGRDENSDWKTFTEYTDWYKTIRYDIPKHSKKKRWPCILSGFDEELLEDGWHRFHRYIDLGCRYIPCIFYT